MSSDLEGWGNLPKSVKLLDISLIGYGIILFVSLILYFMFFDHTVQNLMPIFLCAILALFTWNLKNQLRKNDNPHLQKRLFLEWFVIDLFIIVIFAIILVIYPVTY
ncbi:MAG: hypothetical protein ACTSW1_10425 [Candidatus Hodarchaeales archaeon]